MFIVGEVQSMRRFIAYDGAVDRYFLSSPNGVGLLVVVGMLGLPGLLILGFEVRDGLRATPPLSPSFSAIERLFGSIP
jgi:hypothetical protein